MAGSAHNLEHNEYWRPARDELSQTQVVALAVDLCARCDTEFIAGARFCHICGSPRTMPGEATAVPRWLNFSRMMRSLDLPLGAMIAFLVGVACLLAAVGVGIVYTATTVLDWQAIQAWRIQWLLAATAAFVGGLLLRQPKG